MRPIKGPAHEGPGAHTGTEAHKGPAHDCIYIYICVWCFVFCCLSQIRPKLKFHDGGFNVRLVALIAQDAARLLGFFHALGPGS